MRGTPSLAGPGLCPSREEVKHRGAQSHTRGGKGVGFRAETQCGTCGGPRAGDWVTEPGVLHLLTGAEHTRLRMKQNSRQAGWALLLLCHALPRERRGLGGAWPGAELSTQKALTSVQSTVMITQCFPPLLHTLLGDQNDMASFSQDPSTCLDTGG